MSKYYFRTLFLLMLIGLFSIHGPSVMAQIKFYGEEKEVTLPEGSNESSVDAENVRDIDQGGAKDHDAEIKFVNTAPDDWGLDSGVNEHKHKKSHQKTHPDVRKDFSQEQSQNETNIQKARRKKKNNDSSDINQ